MERNGLSEGPGGAERRCQGTRREGGHGPKFDVQPGMHILHILLRGPEATRMLGIHVCPHLTGQREPAEAALQ